MRRIGHKSSINPEKKKKIQYLYLLAVTWLFARGLHVQVIGICVPLKNTGSEEDTKIGMRCVCM